MPGKRVSLREALRQREAALDDMLMALGVADQLVAAVRAVVVTERSNLSFEARARLQRAIDDVAIGVAIIQQRRSS